MIPFFRKIRYRLAKNNQFFKYSRYAIGEIVLVVIGILIALQINNWNEKNKAKEKTNLLFGQVQKELLYNIERCNFVVDWYRGLDSIYYKVLNKKATYDDYKSNSLYTETVTLYEQVLLVDDAFTNLLETDGQLSFIQDSIVLKLKGLYGTKKKRTDETDLKIGLVVDDYLAKLNNEKKWYGDFMRGERTDEMIEYFLTDPFYFNQLNHYCDKGLVDHMFSITNFRNEATNIYEELSDNLNIKKDSSVVKNIKDYEHYIGTYDWDSIHNVNFVVEKNKLKMNYLAKNDTIILESHPIYLESKKHFMVLGLIFGELIFDENGEVTKFVFSNYGNRKEAKKID